MAEVAAVAEVVAAEATCTGTAETVFAPPPPPPPKAGSPSRVAELRARFENAAPPAAAVAAAPMQDPAPDVLPAGSRSSVLQQPAAACTGQ